MEEMTKTKTFTHDELLKRSRRGWISFIIVIAAAIVLSLFVRNVVGPTYVTGVSMEPTLHEGQFAIVDWINYTLHRYDLVAADIPESRNGTLVKRLCGMPGDVLTVETCGEDCMEDAHYHLLVNGERPPEGYDIPMIFPGDMLHRGVVLGDDEYFLLGDNRAVSYDSRKFGIVTRDEIKGVFVVY